MKHVERLITVFIILCFIFVVLFVDFGSRENKIIVYDCGLLEYYKNFPKELKDECVDNLDKKENEEAPKSNSRFQHI